MRFAPPRASRAPEYTALMARGHVDECEDVGRGMAEERSCLAPRREPLNVICHASTVSGSVEMSVNWHHPSEPIA
mgnify:FL=1